MSPAEAFHNVSVVTINFAHWWRRCGRNVVRIGKWGSAITVVVAMLNGGGDVIKSGLRAANAMPATEAYVVERLAPVQAQLETLHNDIVILQGKISAPMPTEVKDQLGRIEGLLLGLQKKPAASFPKSSSH